MARHTEEASNIPSHLPHRLSTVAVAARCPQRCTFESCCFFYIRLMQNKLIWFSYKAALKKKLVSIQYIVLYQIQYVNIKSDCCFIYIFVYLNSVMSLPYVSLCPLLFCRHQKSSFRSHFWDLLVGLRFSLIWWCGGLIRYLISTHSTIFTHPGFLCYNAVSFTSVFYINVSNALAYWMYTICLKKKITARKRGVLSSMWGSHRWRLISLITPL